MTFPVPIFAVVQGNRDYSYGLIKFYVRENAMKDALKKEFTRRITQANPVSMITVLYDMTLVYLGDAREALEAKQKKKFVQEIHHAQDCLQELANSLQLNYEQAPALHKLYIYIHKALATAIISFSVEPLTQPESILKRLRDAYSELEKTGSFEPVMKNAQQVYAGLTYGKNSLVESMPETGVNRGFLA